MMGLREVMKRAIGNDRTITEFAHASKVSPTKISDCLYGEIPDFSNDEILRMAGNAYGGITYADLFNRLGDDTVSRNSKGNFVDASKLFVDVLRFQLEHITLIDDCKVDNEYQVIRSLVETVKTYYPDNDTYTHLEVGIDLKHTLDNVTIVQLSWYVENNEAIMEFALVYNDKGLNHNVKEVIFDSDELFKYGGEIENTCEVIAEKFGYNYALNLYSFKTTTPRSILAPKTAEEKLIDAIFGKEGSQVQTVEGYGFKLPDDVDSVRKFYEDNLDTVYFMRNRIFRTTPDKLTYYEYCKYVADIITYETSIRVYYYQSDDGAYIVFPAKLPWEMNGMERNLSKDTLYSVLDVYALKFGTTIQKCYIQTTKTPNGEFDDVKDI